MPVIISCAAIIIVPLLLLYLSGRADRKASAALLKRLADRAAARKVHPLGDPCDKLSDEQANGGVPALPRGFVGERISHSTENDRG